MPSIIQQQTGVANLANRTVRDMIEETRRHCTGTIRSQQNQLLNGMQPTDTTITFTWDIGSIARGEYLAIEDEIVLVWSTNPSARSIVAQRGQLGTIPVAHTATTMVEVDPRFSTFAIRNALVEEIQSWPDGLFQVATLPFTLVGQTSGGGAGTLSGVTFINTYDLSPLTSDGVLFLLEVRHAPWTQQNRNSWPQADFTFERFADTTQFPSGLALHINDTIQMSVPAHVTYAAPFNLTNMSDTIPAVGSLGLGLSTYMVDIPPIGAALRLLEPREISRAQSEAFTQEREAREVPPDMIGRIVMRLQQKREKRLSEEMKRLYNRWPQRWA